MIQPSHMCLLTHLHTSTTSFKDRELAAWYWNHISHSSTQDWTVPEVGLAHNFSRQQGTHWHQLH